MRKASATQASSANSAPRWMVPPKVGSSCQPAKVFVTGKLKPLRIAPRPAHQPVKKQLRHIDQHQRRENFIGVEARFEQARNGAIKRPADNAHDEHDNKD